MPKSKRPRKKLVRRHHYAVGSTLFIPTEVIEGLRMELVNLEIAMYEKLHRGLVTDREMEVLRDAFNGFGVAMVSRRVRGQETLRLCDLPENREALVDVIAAKKAWSSYARRRFEGVMAVTGDELNALQKGFQVVFPFIDESLSSCPRTMVKEIYAGRELTGEREHDRQVAEKLWKRSRESYGDSGQPPQ